MTWFCGSRQKRHNKSKVCNIDYSRDDNDNIVPASSGRPFAVVLQNFEASVSDELSVTRGQVVEKLYQDGEWVYVRNFDLSCGYIPLNFCYWMNHIVNGGQHWNANDIQESSLRVESPQTRPRPKSINLGAFIRNSGSQSSVELHNIEQRTNTPNEQTPQRQQRATSVVPSSPHSVLPVRSSTPVTATRSAQRLETSNSTPPIGWRNRRQSLPQPLIERAGTDGAELTILEEPRYVDQSHNNNIAATEGVDAASFGPSRPMRATLKRSLSMNEGARFSCRPNIVPFVQRKDAIHHSISYQDAVRSAGQDPYRLIAGYKQTLMHRESPLNPRFKQGPATPPQRTSPLNPRRQQGGLPEIRQCNCEGGQGAMNYDPADDVFLPEPKKPVGIYRCLQAYQPRYQSGLSVKEGELVILLEFGRGDWAWVLTSMNKEGLLPRQYLVRYNPFLGVGGPGVGGAKKRNGSSNAATQTELVIEGCVRHVSGASSASAGATAYSASSSSSVTSPQTTPPLPQRSKRLRTRARASTRAREVRREGGEERCVVASPAAQAKESSPQWFENVDSLERPLQRTRPTHLGCSLQTTPPLKQRRHPKAMATPKSADCSYPGDRSLNPSALVTPKLLKSADYAGPSGADVWFNSLSSTTSTVSQTPVLTALKDYDPPSKAKNCLRLAKGDVLNTQPHMEYPKGWMWVWHTTQRSFGYVPQSHVGYVYPVHKGERSRRNTVEDAV